MDAWGSSQIAGLGDPYAELGVPRNATEAEIRSAFRRAARAHHSDVLGVKARADARRAADAKFGRLRAAHDVLLDPLKRRQLDEALIHRRRQGSPSSSAEPEPNGAAPTRATAQPATGPGASASGPRPGTTSLPHQSRPIYIDLAALALIALWAALRKLDFLRRDTRGMAAVAAVALPILYDFLATHPLPVVLAVWLALFVVQAALAGRVRRTPLAFVARLTVAGAGALASLLRGATRVVAPATTE